MLTPSFEDFQKLSRQGNLIPVYEEILADMETPVSAFQKVKQGNYAFLLESVEGGEKWGRYSFLGSEPARIFRSRGTRVEEFVPGEEVKAAEAADPLLALKALMARYRPVVLPGLPRFFGGAVGFLSYDLVRFMERLPDRTPDELCLYDSIFIISKHILIFDKQRNSIKVVANVFLDDYASPEEAYLEAKQDIARLIHRLGQPLKGNGLPKHDGAPLFVNSNFRHEDFLAAVRRGREYIEAGDIIQVVLSQRFSMEAEVDPFNLYRSLRVINPSPYLFFLQFDDLFLVGSSPEALVRREGERVELKPIAGTMPRGKNDAEDQTLARQLTEDPKERAEHIMLVDLGRNDLGRVCRYGTVKVGELMRVEKYSHVMHLVSDVEGVLREDRDAFDVIRAAFPAGTLTGAPKVRAMEIIEELEPCRRGPYGGAVGYFGFSGNMDMGITIRTLIVKQGRVHVQAGAGIVYDSDPEKEFKECQNKAKGMLKAVEMARRELALHSL